MKDMMENEIPVFVREQEFFNRNPGFQIQLKKIGNRVPLEKRKTIFISHSWDSSLDDDIDQEKWVHFFVVNLAKHIEWLGFKVMLDARDIGIGIHLNSTTQEAIANIDFALLLVTRSYLQKIERSPQSGVAIELNFFQERLSSNSMKAKPQNENFFVVFSLVDNLNAFPIEKYLPLFINQLGYLKALLILPAKLYGLDVAQIGEVFIKPSCVIEQEQVCADLDLQEEFKKIGGRVSPEKKKRIFISRAWPLPTEEDPFYEQWTDVFVQNLVKHLELLGFNVILDAKDLGIGVHLNTAMKESVNKADHVLLIITNTYLYKIKEAPASGVAVEFSYIKERVRVMGGGSVAGQSRFLLSFSVVNDLSGFPIIEGHGGFASVFINQVGYVKAILELSHKLYGHDISFPAAVRHFGSKYYFLNSRQQINSVVNIDAKEIIKPKL